MRIVSYFRADYIWLSLVKAIFASFVTGVIFVAIYIYYNFESFLENAYEIDFVALGKQAGTLFLKLLIVYLVISYAVAVAKYMIARSNIRKYKSNLKKIRKIDRTQKENE